MAATFAGRLRDVASMDEAEAAAAAAKMMVAWDDAGESYETLKRRYTEQRAGKVLIIHSSKIFFWSNTQFQ